MNRKIAKKKTKKTTVFIDTWRWALFGRVMVINIQIMCNAGSEIVSD